MRPTTQDQRAAIFKNMDDLREKQQRQQELMGEMRRALINEWIKEDQMNITNKDFLSLLCAYHDAVERDREQFVWKGKDFLTAYAKYLLEYLEGQFLKQGDHNFETRLRSFKSDHRKRMQAKALSHGDSKREEN